MYSSSLLEGYGWAGMRPCRSGHSGGCHIKTLAHPIPEWLPPDSCAARNIRNNLPKRRRKSGTLGNQMGNPTPTRSENTKSSISLPILRWSRFLASSSIADTHRACSSSGTRYHRCESSGRAFGVTTPERTCNTRNLDGPDCASAYEVRYRGRGR